MRLALNTLFRHYPQSGTGRYLQHLLAGLPEGIDRFDCSARALPPTDGAAVAREGFWRRRLLATPFDRRSPPMAKVWFEQLAFPWAAGRWRATVAHVPYFAPPLVPGVPTVVTVHDLVPLLRPEYRRTAAERWYTALVSQGLRSATRVITDSEASARDLRRRLGIPAARIRAIPLGVSERFHPLSTPEEQALADRALNECGLTEPYLLYVGGFDRRKNVARLLAAYAQLRRQVANPPRLALVGARPTGDPFFYDPRPDLERWELDRSVALLGPVSDAALQRLLARAVAFVFPSLYEGFGLPPLEAMACGTAVVCSQASSLPEVVGDAGVLVDPESVEALAAALARVVTDRDWRRELGRRGLARAAQFRWAETVAATVAVYHEVSREPS
jgi:glycosyltransferase involved in cell wall biosynthesis